MKLYQEHLIVAIFPAILLIVLCIAVSSQLGENLIENLYHQRSDLELQRHADKISFFFKEKLLATKMLATAPAVRSALPGDAVAFLKAEFRGLAEDFEGLYYNDRDGNVYGVNGERFNVKDRSYFPKIDRGEIVFTDVEKSRATNNRIILLLVPVFNENFNRTGAVGAAIQIERLIKELQNIDSDKDSITILLGPENSLISTGSLSGIDGRELVKQITGISPGSRKSVMFANEIYLLSSVQITFGGWTVVNALKESKVRAAAQGPLRTIFLVAGIVTLFAGALAIILSCKVLHPVTPILGTLKELSNGNLSARISGAEAPSNELGDIARAVNIMAESLEQKNRELETLNSTLEEKIHDRTLALHAANEELESFSYSVSHDLRAPLRVVDGFSLALLEDCSGQLKGNAVDYINKVRLASRKMENLIEAMLRLSRASRGTMRTESFDLSLAVKHIVNSYTERASNSKVTFIIQPDLRAECDPDLVTILLDNFLSNAIKYSSKKDLPVIEFGKLSEADAVLKGFNSPEVYFVRDNGAGFDMHYHNKLFNAFQRLHQTKDFEGVGIGLATVLRVINRHGGQVKAEGKPGEGAVFCFSLS